LAVSRIAAFGSRAAAVRSSAIESAFVAEAGRPESAFVAEVI
jgi:hypothetical protein